MKKKFRALKRSALSLLLALTMTLSFLPAYAQAEGEENLLTNGDFETGGYTGWTVNVAIQIFLVLVSQSRSMIQIILIFCKCPIIQELNLEAEITQTVALRLEHIHFLLMLQVLMKVLLPVT